MDWGLRVVAREVAKSMRVSSEAGRRLPSVPRQLYVIAKEIKERAAEV